jgi:hypothetical protein
VRPQLKSMSEEIVRWGFEIQVHKSEDWYIAFTNPTAGPWKRLLAKSANGVLGEVHRFAVDEKRPDLVLVSDRYETVLIIEAKPTVAGLANQEQMSKTADLFLSLSGLLRSKSGNEFWGEKSEYCYQQGLLWSPTATDNTNRRALSEGYLSKIGDSITDVLCIEGELSNDSITYQIHWGSEGICVSLDDYQS